MSKVHAVLLVPHEGDPLGLLREGPCGARPPIAVREQARSRPERRRALVLAWDGAVVPEGCFRASMGSRYMSATSVHNVVQMALHRYEHGDAPTLEERGTLILLDAEGREVTDV